MPKAITKKELKELIIKELPGLIRKDLSLRRFIIDLTAERYPDKKKTEDRFDRILQRLEENDKRWEENQKRLERIEIEWNKRWEENQKRLERIEVEWNKRWEENQKRLERMELEWNKRWEENQKRLERIELEWNKRWEENQKRLERMELEWNKRWEENQKVINRILEEIKLLRERQEAEAKRVDRKFDSTIGALGARWGLMAEESFRNGLKAILEESFNVKVERYHDFDAEGVVFGRPDQIELDLLIYNNTLIIAELKSSMSKSDMYSFIKKIEFYESKHNVKARRRIVISPMVDPKALEVAKAYGIEVYNYADEVNLSRVN